MRKTPAKAAEMTAVLDLSSEAPAPAPAKRAPRTAPVEASAPEATAAKSAPLKAAPAKAAPVKPAPMKSARKIPVQAAPSAPVPVRAVAETPAAYFTGEGGRAWRMSGKHAVAYVRDAGLAGELLATEPRHLAKSAMAVYYDRKGRPFAWQVRFDSARWEKSWGGWRRSLCRVLSRPASVPPSPRVGCSCARKGSGQEGVRKAYQKTIAPAS